MRFTIIDYGCGFYVNAGNNKYLHATGEIKGSCCADGWDRNEFDNKFDRNGGWYYTREAAQDSIDRYENAQRALFPMEYKNHIINRYTDDEYYIKSKNGEYLYCDGKTYPIACEKEVCKTLDRFKQGWYKTIDEAKATIDKYENKTLSMIDELEQIIRDYQDSIAKVKELVQKLKKGN